MIILMTMVMLMVFYSNFLITLMSYITILFAFSMIDFSTMNFYLFSTFQMDLLTSWMVLMIAMSMLLSMMAAMKDMSHMLMILINSITIASIVMVLVKSLLMMYIMFEFSIIPILMIILGWGNQPERESAGMALMFYTAFCSIPLMLMLMKLMDLFQSVEWWWIFMCPSMFKNNFQIFSLILLVAFMVKLPIFSGHMWLPKAHVEAPVYGSMILAAVMLKLGGFGVIRIISSSETKINNFFISLSLMGMVVTSMICLSLFDLKMIVAYSSVGHMGVVIITLLTSSLMSIKTASLMMVSHAFTSSMMFLGVTKIYSMTSSRSMLMNQGNLKMMPKFTLLWMLTIMGSMATPPLMSFFSEVINFILISAIFKLSYLFIILAIFISGIYSLMIYVFTQQAAPNYTSSNFNFYSSMDYFISFTHVLLFISLIFTLMMIC